jgi:prepilin-type N-terminal cleavage/methylation domain-containing protein
MSPFVQSHRAATRRSGFTLLELTLAMVVLTLAAGMLATSMGSVGSIGSAQSERAIASEAARTILERMRNVPFNELFATYNANPADDPDGEGTAPGCHFAAGELEPWGNDQDGSVGFVYFPGNGTELREDSTHEKLGLPRDLDLDGTVGAEDVSESYRLLPVEVRVEWTSRGARREFRIWTQFAPIL